MADAEFALGPNSSKKGLNVYGDCNQKDPVSLSLFYIFRLNKCIVPISTFNKRTGGIFLYICVQFINLLVLVLVMF